MTIGKDFTHPRSPPKLEMLYNLLRGPQSTRCQQSLALRRLVRHAFQHVPFYRQLWTHAGVDVSAFRGLPDLARLPVVDKARLVAAGPDTWDPRVPHALTQDMTTSGTSGCSIRVRRTQREMITLRMGFARPLLINGARPGQRFITFASPWLEQRKGSIFSRVATTRFIDPLADLDDQIKVFETFQPDGVIGQAGGIYLLARELHRRGRTLPVGRVMVYGTTLMPEMRRTLQDVFGTAPVNLYGAVESGWIAWQCRQGHMHIDADRILVELLDDDGRPVGPGQVGHVVLTSLFGFTMPFIRYRLADLASFGRQSCSCRCRFPLLESIQGRVNDFLPTPAGQRVSPHFFFHLFDHGANPVKEWRLTQHDLHDLVYEYIPETHFDPRVFDHGMNLIRQRFGPTVKLRSVVVRDLPLSPAGKRMCIVSKLRPETLAGVVPWTEQNGVHLAAPGAT